MADDNVTSLGAARALKNADNRLWGPVDCLEDALKDVKDKPCDKLLIVRVYTENDTYKIGYHCAQLRASEIIAVLEVTKAFILEEMGY